MKTHHLFLELTDKEIVKLDGSKNLKVQEEVNKAKKRIRLSKKLSEVPESINTFITDCLFYARKKKILRFIYKDISSCRICGKKAGYAKYKRDGKYHWKGDPNYDKPLTFGGVELADEFVIIERQATLGCCDKCWKQIRPILCSELKANKIKAEIHKGITGEEPRYKRLRDRKCSKCEWTGHEGEMGRRPTIMGNGSYPAICPKCGAGDKYFDKTIKTLDSWSLVKC
jgi:hypothetical protein